MKKDNDNEERLIETIVTIGTLIFFGLLSMYAMRGCSYDGGVSNGELTSTPAVVATATAATGVAIGLETDNTLTDGVALATDMNNTDGNISVDDMDVDANATTTMDGMDTDENTTVGDTEANATTEVVDASTDDEASDKNATNADAKNGTARVVADTDAAEAGILADINSASISAKPYVLKGIFFRSGSSILTKKSKRQLDAIAKALKEHKDVKVTIRGHTDSKGSKKANKRLSFKRASSTGMALVDRGVNIDNIWIDGMGETEPITKNGTAKEMLLNRRVDIAVSE